MNSSRTDGLWIKEEMSTADFGDLRLNKRFQVLASELASKPSQPINQASVDWASAKAAYRFFNNPKVKPESIVKPHILSTQQRAKDYQRLVVVQDTSFIDFTKHIKTFDLGSIGKTRDGFEPQGLILHCALALSDKGLPLGLLSHNVWSRTRVKSKDSHYESLLPKEKKESFKWFKGLRDTIKNTPNQEVIMVCDREADIYEFIEESVTSGVDFVVRVKHPRMLEDDLFGDINVFDRIAVEAVHGRINIEVPGSGKRAKRSVDLIIKFFPVTYSGQPRGIRTKQVSRRSHLELNIVHLYEENPPKGESPIHWTLVTTLESKNKIDALEVVRYYKMRWQVELYFKSLKTGCGVELCRLSRADKLIRYITLQSVIAWRIIWMTFLNRINPETSCESFLTEDEWKTLWLKKHRVQIKLGRIKAKPPDTAPTTYEAIRWIAMQGGFLGRKHDGEPGQITIWRGWLDLIAAVEVYEILK